MGKDNVVTPSLVSQTIIQLERFQTKASETSLRYFLTHRCCGVEKRSSSLCKTINANVNSTDYIRILSQHLEYIIHAENL